MSQIICARCGEPWDSTGGLHFTHSDLIEQDYKRLVDGAGCLCCRENLREGAIEYAEVQVEAWQRSVEHLCEGRAEFMYVTFDKQPRRVPLDSLPMLGGIDA